MLGRRPSRAKAADSANHKVSLLLTSTGSGRTFQRTVSWRTVRALLGAVVCVALVVVVGVVGLVGWVQSASRMRHLQAENDSLRVQFQRLGALEADLARMSELNDKMQRMLGVEPTAAGMDQAEPAEPADSGMDQAR